MGKTDTGIVQSKQGEMLAFSLQQAMLLALDTGLDTGCEGFAIATCCPAARNTTKATDQNETVHAFAMKNCECYCNQAAETDAAICKADYKTNARIL